MPRPEPAVDGHRESLGFISDRFFPNAANEESRTGPQSYRVVMETIGLIGNSVSIHNGDVNDNSQHVHLASADLRRNPAREAELKQRLGL